MHLPTSSLSELNLAWTQLALPFGPDSGEEGEGPAAALSANAQPDSSRPDPPGESGSGASLRAMLLAQGRMNGCARDCPVPQSRRCSLDDKHGYEDPRCTGS